MNTKLYGWDDTITALATPPGIAALGVIRVSGTDAFNICNKMFISKDLTNQPGHTLHVGVLKHNGQLLDEVVLSIFRSPKSYTGEDMVEISCHGSPYVQQIVLNAIISSGARLAKPGEFTQRAFLNGKLDLTQAEAVGDLIASNSAASQRAAMYNIKGRFSDLLKQFREKLIEFSALIELELDFSEEDVEFADRSRLKNLIESLSQTTKRLLQSFALGNVIKNGVSVAIVGKPNAGKSTLLNTLLNDERAIVSDIPGTTRDTIEEVLNIEGILFRMIDTAGLRQHSDDKIEMIGIAKSQEKITQAEVVLYVFDVKNFDNEELIRVSNELHDRNKKYILVGNKSDELASEQLMLLKHDLSEVLFISARDDKGINELKESLFNKVAHGALEAESMIITNSRHFQALEKVNESLENIKNGLHDNLYIDLLSLEIRNCLHYLGELTGEVTNEDRLDYIFSKFCIGK
ncbi:MAG: tRNA uridine-5-carboxymethylaminomethyl(34) synthesis GTPase MnmE [Ginsengibacter sp.]